MAVRCRGWALGSSEPLGSAGDDDAGAVPDIDHHESNTPERNEGDDSASADHAEQTGDANAEEAEETPPDASTSRDPSDSEAKSEGERDEKILRKADIGKPKL